MRRPRRDPPAPLGAAPGAPTGRFAPVAARSVTVVIDVADELVARKSGIGRSGIAAVEREAEILAHLHHPNVVELIRTERSDTAATLVTRFAGRSTLGALRPGDVTTVARHAHSLLTIVGELHALGWSHGRISGEHCVLGTAGRITLCGLGRARPATIGDAKCDADLAACARLVAELADRIPEPTGRRQRSDLRALRRLVARPDEFTHRTVHAALDGFDALLGAGPTAPRGTFPRAFSGTSTGRRRRGPSPVKARTGTSDTTTRPSRPAHGGSRRWAGAAATVATMAALFGVVALLRWLGGPLADPFAVDGVRRIDGIPRPVALALGLVRAGAFVVCLYGIALSAATLAAIATQRRDLRRLATSMAPPRLRRALVALIGFGLVASAAGPQRTSGTPTETHETPVRTQRDTSTPDNGVETQVARAPAPSSAVQPASTAPDSDDDPATDDATASDDATVHLGRPAPSAPAPSPHHELPNLWVMGPGDHLWRVAEVALSRHLGRPALDDEITDYWRAVVELNRGSLIDPFTPDLVFVGQVIELPPFD